MLPDKLPEDFTKLYEGHKLAVVAEDRKPVYLLWVFDPQEDKVIVEHNVGKHHAEVVDHTDLAKKVKHPERIHGYGYKIKGGWRITDYEHKPVEDGHVLALARQALIKAYGTA